jgi:hypothetical protein
MNPFKRIKPAHVIVTMSNGEVVDGTINVGFEERVLDFLLGDKAFVAVFDVGKSSDVMLLNKTHIVLVQPKEEGTGFVERERQSPS